MADPKLLIVDDSAFMRHLVVKAVEAAGFSNIVEAENGEDAIAKYRSESPDVMLMDLIMPKKTGLEVLKELVPEGAKIIVISAIGQQEVMNEAFTLGARGYFIKPFFADAELKTMVTEVLAGEIVKPDEPGSEHLKEYMKVAKHGAEHSATALSTIMGRTVKVEESAVALADTKSKITECGEHLPESVSAITGLLVDVPGAAYITLKTADAYKMIDLLQRAELGTTTSLESEMERSTLEEVLNIVSNSYMSVFTDLGIEMLAAELPYVITPEKRSEYLEKFLKRGTEKLADEVVVFSSELAVADTDIKLSMEFVTYSEQITT